MEFRLKVVVVGFPKLLRSFGVSSSLTFLCNSRLFVSDLSYNYLYLHDLYPAMSDIYFMISLCVYSMLDMISHLASVHGYPFQYLYVCSSMMCVHPNGGASRGILEYITY